MDIRVDILAERLEGLAAIARSEDAALLDAYIENIRIMRSECQRSDVWNMRRWRKGPAIASRQFEEGGAFAKGVTAVLAAENPRVRSSNEDFGMAIGCGRDRPDLFVAGAARRNIAPYSPAIV